MADQFTLPRCRGPTTRWRRSSRRRPSASTTASTTRPTSTTSTSWCRAPSSRDSRSRQSSTRRQARRQGWHLQQCGAGLEPHVLLELPQAEGWWRAKGELAAKIDAAFGNLDNFKKEFANAAVTQFGSGGPGSSPRAARSSWPRRATPKFPLLRARSRCSRSTSGSTPTTSTTRTAAPITSTR